MGLDMYAHRRLYTKRWDHHKPEDSYLVRVDRGGKPVAGVRSERITLVEEEVMTWRKANQIHAWFVDNVQNGEDDCGQYRVSIDKLTELLDACQQVDVASKLVDGMVVSGYSFDNEGKVPLRRLGRVIEDATVAQQLLPTREGFFFGSTEYDEEYLRDVKDTRRWLEDMFLEMAESNESWHVYYSSSW